MCSRLVNSCACARSVSVVLRVLSSSWRSAISSVRSRSVTTAPSAPIGIRFITSTRPRRSTIWLSPVTWPVSTSTSRSFRSRSRTPRPTQSSGRLSRVRAWSLTRVMRCCRSRPTTPSRMPCSSASRCSIRPVISLGSRPSVCRLTRRASSTDPATPSTVAMPSSASASPAELTAPAKNVGASLPAATMPITRPLSPITGTCAAIEPPSSSTTPTQVRPRVTVLSPSGRRSPIWSGSGEVSTVRSGSMITT